jgi:hypothetical protein
MDLDGSVALEVGLNKLLIARTNAIIQPGVKKPQERQGDDDLRGERDDGIEG